MDLLKTSLLVFPWKPGRSSWGCFLFAILRPAAAQRVSPVNHVPLNHEVEFQNRTHYITKERLHIIFHGRYTNLLLETARQAAYSRGEILACKLKV